MLDRPDYDFSYSGLKTAVLNYVKREQAAGREINLADLSAGFQAAIVDVQVAKALRATEEHKIKRVVLAGGVAANTGLCGALKRETEAKGLRFFSPSLSLCTDNAAMVAALGYENLKEGKTIDLSANANANLPLG